MTNAKTLYIAIITIAFLHLGGCAIIPTPEHYCGECRTRGKISKEILQFIHVGSTRKEEVLLKLGEPDRVWKDERAFLYLSQMTVAIIGSVGSAAGIPRTHLVFIEFNKDNVVNRFEMKEGIYSRQRILDEIGAW
jgi:outer membrane protein assembly factor BamE (lipoprotein component of BamABCDE complex)